MRIYFNGLWSDDARFGIKSIVRGVTRPILSSSRLRTQTIPGRAGAYYFGRDREAKEHELRFFIQADSWEQLRDYAREIASWLDTENLSYLRFSDEPDKRYKAVQINDMRPEEIVKNAFVDVTFWAEPEAEADTISIKGASGENEGTAPTPVVIRGAAEAGEEIKVTYTQTEQEIIIDHTFNGGESVMIDTGRRKVEVDDTDVRADVDIDSDYFKLHPGNYDFTASGMTIDEVEFRKRWK